MASSGMDELIDLFDEDVDVEAHADRPWWDWHDAGIADPPPFDWDEHANIQNGSRAQVLCYGLDGLNSLQMRDNVLLSYPLDACSEAYAPVKDKPPVRTIMGHLQVYSVLRRRVGSVEGQIVYEITPDFVAVKVALRGRMMRLRSLVQENVMKEIVALQLVGSIEADHVLGCRTVLYDDSTDTLNVVLPYCREGDMFDLIRSVRPTRPQAGAPVVAGGLSEDDARYWMGQILDGLQDLRNLGFCHRDLSPENIMMDANNALVIDLGLCLRVPYLEDLQGPAATPNWILDNVDNRDEWTKMLTKPQGAVGKLPYMAPEIFCNTEFDGEVADVWSAGTILFCMLTGTRSYHMPGDAEYGWMTSNLQGLFQALNVVVSLEVLDLLRGMLQPNAALRLTLDEVLDHEWFQAASDSE